MPKANPEQSEREAVEAWLGLLQLELPISALPTLAKLQRAYFAERDAIERSPGLNRYQCGGCKKILYSAATMADDCKPMCVDCVAVFRSAVEADQKRCED